MRSYGQLWSRITSEENLRAAWRRVRRNHASSDEVRAFESDLEGNLVRLRTSLLDGTYRPGGYRQFKIWDPKPRIISCAPVVDRVVHHALCGVIAPVFERSYVETSYACREGKGGHAACAEVQRLARRHAYFLKFDIRHYFDTIDHARLLHIVLPHFRERALKDLIRLIVESYETEPGKGLPIGNLTSQWFANTFLDALDHRLAEKLDVRHVRYMDDVIVFAETKTTCWRVMADVRKWLDDERGLEIKDEATVVAPVSEGVPFLGIRIFRSCWRLQHRRFWRTRHHQRVVECEFLRGERTWESLQASARAMDGCVRWYGFKGILTRTRDKEISATEERAASGSNRHNRGGSWNNSADNCTSSNRNNNNPDNRNNNLGFRLFCTVINGSESNSERPVSGSVSGTNMAGLASTGKRVDLAHSRRETLDVVTRERRGGALVERTGAGRHRTPASRDRFVAPAWRDCF